MQCPAVKTTLKFGALTAVPEHLASSPNGSSAKIAPFWLIPAAVGSPTTSNEELDDACGRSGRGGNLCGVSPVDSEWTGARPADPGGRASSGRARLIRAGVQKRLAADAEDRGGSKPPDQEAVAAGTHTPSQSVKAVAAIANGRAGIASAR